MNAKDRIKLNGYNTPKFPKMKGRVKITLHNVHNGKNEIIEGENIVTNAVADIFANNYMGAIDYSKLMPLWSKWFGGVLCYNSAHPNLDADKYYCYSENNNSLVAHAGQLGIDVQHDDDMRAGNPTTSAYVETENSIKQVWEWGTTHGNGTIRSLSLCHTDIGDAGLGGTNYRFQNLSPFEVINGSQLSNVNSYFNSGDNLVAQYDDNHGIGFEIGDGTGTGDEGWYSGHLGFQTDKITVFVRRLPYAKSGLFETFNARTNEERKFTITDLPFDLFCQPCFYFEPNTKYLWIFSNVTGIANYSVTWDNANVRYFKIDCENEELVDLGSGVYYKTLPSDTSDLAPICYIRRLLSNNYRNASIIKDGDYVYFPTTSGVNWSQYYDSGEDLHINGFKKIKIDTGTNSGISLTTDQNHLKPMIKQGDILLSSGMVINDEGYSCVNQLETFYGTWGIQETDQPSMLVLPNRSTSTATSTARYILASKFLNTTKFNLNTAITKSASQSMTVEYTLTEV